MIRDLLGRKRPAWPAIPRLGITAQTVARRGIGTRVVQNPLPEHLMAELHDPSKGVKAIAASANIGLHTELRYFGVQNLSLNKPALLFYQSHRHCFNPFASKYLDFRNPSPMAELTLSRHLSRIEEPLWWHVSVAADVKTIGVVRTKAQLKTRRALRLALRLEGYDRTGRRADETSAQYVEESAAEGRPVDNLRGSLGIVIKDSCEVIDTEFRKLVEVMRSLVVRLREYQRLARDVPRERAKWTTDGGSNRRLGGPRNYEQRPDGV